MVMDGLRCPLGDVTWSKRGRRVCWLVPINFSIEFSTIHPVYNALYFSVFCSLDVLPLYQMQAAIVIQAPPADSKETMRTTMIIAVVLFVGVAAVSTGVAELVGKLVGVLEAA